MNIRLKLSIQFTAIVLSILVLFSFSIYYFSSNFRKNDFSNRLQEKAITTAKLLIEVKEVDSVLLKIIDRNTVNILENEYIIIYDESNTPIYKNTDEINIKYGIDLIDKVKKQKRVYFSNDKYECIGVIFEWGNKDFVVIASAYDKYGLKELRNLKIILILGLLFTFLLTFFAGLFYSERAMKPILMVIKQVNNIRASHLDARVNEGNGKDEIARLAITFNKMLSRLELAFNSQRQFVSNISHELRTPLTSITGQLEVTLMKKREVEEYEILLKSLHEDIKTLNSLSNGLLELAHSNIDIHAFELNIIRIDEVLYVVQNELMKSNQDYLIIVDFENFPEDEQKLRLNANENLLKIAFKNIIDNACKFSKNKKVEINLGFNDKYLYIKFIDLGIGIPSEEIDKIFEPFYRATNSFDILGHGIGLSLVKKIIELHNGKMEISSVINEGTVISIFLPNY
jgi:signal transduction histidine kinase